MFTVKIVCHLMPWELDHALLAFIKFRKSFEKIPKDIHVKLSCVLNVSDFLIDWNTSKLPKEFFVQKFKELKSIVDCFDVERYDVVDYTDKIYGHLDLQRDSSTDDVDGYIYFCPDRNFDDTALAYLCIAAKQVEEKYCIISTEIYKAWDSTWDVITNSKYMNVPYGNWDKECPFKLEVENESNDVSLEKIDQFKFAGWFEYYSRDFVNVLTKIPDEWNGYGPWDYYAMLISYQVMREIPKVNVSQYVLRGKINEPLDTIDRPNGFSGYYRDFIFSGNTQRTQDIKQAQRNKIEPTMGQHVLNRVSEFKSGNIKL